MAVQMAERVWRTDDWRESLEAIMEYAVKQKEHHLEKKLIEIYERIDDEE